MEQNSTVKKEVNIGTEDTGFIDCLDETAFRDETFFQKAALLLAKQYKGLLDLQSRLKRRLDGNWVFTKDMAIEELQSITANYSGDHVQSSNISDTTARIADRLNNGYMEKRKSMMEKEREVCQREYDYASWKVGIIESAILERLSMKDQAIFVKHYGEGWSYRKMLREFTGGGLSMQAVRDAISEGINAVELQIHCFALVPENDNNMRRLEVEIKQYEEGG